MEELISIRYTFTMNDGTHEVFNIKLDPQTLLLVADKPKELPEWTTLNFHKCTICPLQNETYCPLAISLVHIVKRFNRIISYDKIHMDVETRERFISQHTTAQKGISSLMGLVIAASGCPHTAFLKSMARFHLPLASRDETVFRAASMYMLAQYFLHKDNKPVDFELQGLVRLYRNLEDVNLSIAERLNVASKSDSTINALILLDVYNKIMPMAIGNSLDQLRNLFEDYISNNNFNELLAG
ncbi:MAG TPA: hypothetical protein PLP19_08705 [bacterium]|nr:hypothetical protein [bacterium]HPN43553.1 hypothetical protein [bacterium]